MRNIAPPQYPPKFGERHISSPALQTLLGFSSRHLRWLDFLPPSAAQLLPNKIPQIIQGFVIRMLSNRNIQCQE